MPSVPKDAWDKWDIVLKPVGGLLTALSVALVGYLGGQYLNERQTQDTDSRLYTQLISGRETSDSALRQQMFGQIITTFLSTKDGVSASPEDQVLALELLTYNFNDALDLSPLFKRVRSRVAKESRGAESAELYDRLERVANAVISRQIATLVDGGILKGGLVLDFSKLQEHPEGLSLFDDKLTLQSSDGESHPRYFRLWALRVTPDHREIIVSLEISTLNPTRLEAEAQFSLSAFDFPLINNTRLAHGDRVAVVVENLGADSAKIALVYFPGTRASVKDHPFFDELVQKMAQTQSDAPAKHRANGESK